MPDEYEFVDLNAPVSDAELEAWDREARRKFGPPESERIARLCHALRAGRALAREWFDAELLLQPEHRMDEWVEKTRRSFPWLKEQQQDD